LGEYWCTFARKESFFILPTFTYHMTSKIRISLNNVPYNTTLFIAPNWCDGKIIKTHDEATMPSLNLNN
jgi:carbohydrate-binding DOMON domain-containing protein